MLRLYFLYDIIDRINNIGSGVYLLRMTLDDKVISSKVVNIR